MKKITLKITGIEASGHGSGVYEGRKILVLGCFPGDYIRAQTYKEVGSISYAEATSILSPSTLRKSEEFHFPANVPWKQLSEEGEYFLKNEILKNTYKELHILPQKIEYSPKRKHENYRNKLSYAFFENLKGELDFALYTRGNAGGEREAQGENILTHKQIDTLARAFLSFFRQKNVREHNIKYLILRYSYHTQTSVAHVLFPQEKRKELPLKKTDLENFMHAHPQLQGILVSYSPAGIRSSLSHKDFYALGNIDLCERVLNQDYVYHPSLFFQIYPKAFEDILRDLRQVIKKIPTEGRRNLLDLFAGIGIIGIALADLVEKVVGVELSTLSKTYAHKNAEINACHNFSFYEASVNEVLDLLSSEQILVVDPPRSGLSPQTIGAIQEKKPQYLAYISCNPETQARDFKKLLKIYEVQFFKGYNLFPKTHHIESLLILKKR